MTGSRVVQVRQREGRHGRDKKSERWFYDCAACSQTSALHAEHHRAVTAANDHLATEHPGNG